MSVVLSSASIDAILSRYNGSRQNLIPILQDIQAQLGCLPQASLSRAAEHLGLSDNDVFAVASFYPHFLLESSDPRPRRAGIHVCTDAACHLRGSGQLLRNEVKPCSCLGQCDRGPALLIDDQPFATADLNRASTLIDSALADERPQAPLSDALAGPFRTDPYAAPSEHYGALKKLVATKGFDSVIPALKDANLRGMGGAGFPAHIKWNTVRAQAGGEKYIVCNADESEVGTFKDREIIKALPHLIVESMLIAGLTTARPQGIIYVRHEYVQQQEILNREIQRAALAAGILGENVLNSGKVFHLRVFSSPGGYIQGEETALLEALSGKRGHPRAKPSIPAIAGLWQRPTLINNVETFAYVPAILARGAEWFRNQGVNGCQGLKWVSVSGHVNKPGVFEVAMGTTYRQILELAGGVSEGRALKCFAPSGPSFGLLPPGGLDLPADFPDPRNKNPIFLANSTVGSGAIIVFAEGTDMLNVALNFTRFYVNESCGKCVPCRFGTIHLERILTDIIEGRGQLHHLDQLRKIGKSMAVSLCGLGQVAPNPVLATLSLFEPEYRARIAQPRHGGNGKHA